MNRASGDILEAAVVEPASLTRRGKDKLVILTADDEMPLCPSHRQAYGLLGAPQDSHRKLMTGLDDIIGTGNA
ncbi:prevent-host-death protein [Rhizobium tumorigenes]|uniref:Prevent-host-death protein n=1 Tax=Rhizobium tumorigenes TaxID=2041385 RepID=A0AAF1KPY6_9HYPH|nr:prevent-host-death protein [Rhizobium tumorigenes]WFR97785.1 prevent-host-death protein [Rhizobium tumorigenes]WFS03349.1 prevent-host-death protein [Rhizobium tumorigenes]